MNRSLETPTRRGLANAENTENVSDMVAFFEQPKTIESMRKPDKNRCSVQKVNLPGATYGTAQRVEIFEVELSQMFEKQTNQDTETDQRAKCCDFCKGVEANIGFFTVSSAFFSFHSALSAITAFLNTRVFLFKEAVAALARMEELLPQCLRGKIFADRVLDAVSTAVH